VWLAEFAPLADPALVPRAVAAVFALPEQVGCSYADTLCRYLSGQQALLLLDNCEHLIQACAELAEALLRACPHVSILTTSREPLNVPGEVPWRVPSLTTYEGVRLFAERARATRPDFELGDRTTAVVTSICDRLDGIPLALELAAARLRALTLEQIAARLDDRFRLLTGGARTALPRQQTLRATIAWSYDLLTEPERSLLRRLSVFAGGWTLEAAEAVCSDAATAAGTAFPPSLRGKGAGGLGASDVMDLLDALVSKSLVLTNEGVSEVRYRMLETVRQYAAEKLQEAGDAEFAQAHDRHVDYFLALARSRALPGTGQLAHDPEDPIEVELDNYRLALTWGLSRPEEDQRGLELAGALQMLWIYEGHLGEGRAWLAQALAKWIRPTPARARALYSAGVLEGWRGDYGASHGWLTEALQFAPTVGDTELHVNILLTLAAITRAWSHPRASRRADLERAQGYVSEALRVAREAGDEKGVANALLEEAKITRRRASPDEACRLAEQALAIFERLGTQIQGDIGDVHLILANCALDTQRWDLARAHFEQDASRCRQTGHRTFLAYALLGLARVAREQGHFDQALSLLDMCRSPDVSHNLVAGAHIPVDQARVAQMQGDTGRAATLLQEWLDQYRNAGDYDGLAQVLSFMGSLALCRDDVAGAARHYRESLRVSQDVDNLYALAVALVGLAEVAQRQDQPELAARLCGAAAALGDIRHLAAAIALLYVFYTPTDWIEYDCTMAAVCARMGDPAIAAAWADGKRMTLEQVSAYALAF
jgi:predicted ATPase